MLRNPNVLGLVLAGMMIAGVAGAQSVESTGNAAGQSSIGATNNRNTVATDAAANAEAQARASVDAERLRERIVKKATSVSARAIERANAKIEATSKEIDKATAAQSDAAVTTRLATEFGVSRAAVLDEKHDLAASWSDLTIAHSLAANSKADVTANQLIEWQHQGMSWGQVAAGLGLKLNSAVNGIDAEGRVATGVAKADGRLEAMHGEGSRVDAGMTAGLDTGLGAGPAGANIGAGLGAGIKIGH